MMLQSVGGPRCEPSEMGAASCQYLLWNVVVITASHTNTHFMLLMTRCRIDYFLTAGSMWYLLVNLPELGKFWTYSRLNQLKTLSRPDTGSDR